MPLHCQQLLVVAVWCNADSCLRPTAPTRFPLDFLPIQLSCALKARATSIRQISTLVCKKPAANLTFQNLNKSMSNKSAFLKTDIQAGVVVFLVALPLCLGIALASGAPLFSGIISGVIGGIVVGALSGSQLSVSGPAAGLTAIVLAAITSLGSYETFLMAVVLAGILQILLGFAKAGTISNYFPSNVIEGMLTAIGIIIILKQLPHAVGYDVDNEGDFFFIEKGEGHNTFSSIIDAINYSHLGAIVVTLVSLGILIAFNKVPFLKQLKVVPGALVAVVAGVVINEFFKSTGSSLAIQQEHLVNLPVPKSFGDFIGQFSMPNFSTIANPQVWIVAATIATVASIETLLCIEASDKLDPLKRYTNTNTELFAQGAGNMLSGLIGGIPMTSVIVRTSANINSGARTKIATIAHGVLLLLAVLTIPTILNKIPLACLAAILLMIGYKLASPTVFKHMWRNGKYQLVPFLVTVFAVVFTDLLKGVAIGLVVSVFYILRANLKLAYFFKKEDYHDGEAITMKLAQEVSFLNKAAIKQTLQHLPTNSKLIIDASETFYIDHDVLELIRDFLNIGSKDKGIQVTLIGFKDEYNMEHSSHVTSQ
jgi:MFS superfamily sulfate permease-like transporter